MHLSSTPDSKLRAENTQKRRNSKPKSTARSMQETRDRNHDATNATLVWQGFPEWQQNRPDRHKKKRKEQRRKQKKTTTHARQAEKEAKLTRNGGEIERAEVKEVRAAGRRYSRGSSSSSSDGRRRRRRMAKRSCGSSSTEAEEREREERHLGFVVSSSSAIAAVWFPFFPPLKSHPLFRSLSFCLLLPPGCLSRHVLPR